MDFPQNVFQTFSIDVPSVTQVKKINQEQKVIYNVSHYQYNEKDQIGQQKESALFQGIDTDTNVPVVIKVFSKNEALHEISEKAFQNEVNILTSIHVHPNILKYLDYFNTMDGYYIVMEYCEEGSLEKLIEQNKWTGIDNDTILKFISQMAEAFKEIQEQRAKKVIPVLEPSSIFIHNEEGNKKFKIAHFENKKNQEEVSMNHQSRISIYSAPEILFFRDEINSFNSDLWSLGMIVYEMATGKLPFDLSHQMTEEQIRFNLERKRKYSFPADLPEFLIILLKRLLVIDHTKRMRWDNFFEIFPCENSPIVSLRNSDQYNSSTKIEFKPQKSIHEDKPKFPEAIPEEKKIGNFCVPKKFVFTNNITDKLLIYDLDKVLVETHKLNNLSYHGKAVISIDSTIYLAGGRVKKFNKYFSNFYAYSLKSRSTTELCNLLNSKAGLGLCSLKDYIYSIGGYTYDDQIVNKCEEYSIKTNEWISISKIKEQKACVGSTSDLKQYLYIFGGFLGYSMVSNKIERYDTIAKNEWETLSIINCSSIPQTAASGLVVDSDTLLIFGGCDAKDNKNNSISWINLHEMKVENVTSMPFKSGFRFNPLKIKNRTIYALTDESNPEFFKYELITKKWTSSKIIHSD